MSTSKQGSASKSAYSCPKCGQDLTRTNKKMIDKVINFVVRIRRFKCYGCFWEGLKLDKKR